MLRAQEKFIYSLYMAAPLLATFRRPWYKNTVTKAFYTK